MNPVAPPQRGAHVWTANSFSSQADWTWPLASQDVEELLRATSSFTGMTVDDLSTSVVARDAAPLSAELIGRIDALRKTLVDGRGFGLVTGLDVSGVDPTQAAAVFVLIGSLIGQPRSQNASGDLLGHVRNVGADATNPDVRIYQTSARQTFHTDSADVVGLLCLEDAESGGESLLVSAAAIYNEMLVEDQRLAHALFEPVATDRRGEVAPGQQPFFTIPVLSWFDENLTVIYQRQYIDSAQRFPEAPRLTAPMVEALDLFDTIANRPDMHLRMTLAPGDMQFVHNHSLLHDRTGFVDRAGSPRHLLRLWLSVVGDRELPPVFAQRYGSVTIGDRGGVVL